MTTTVAEVLAEVEARCPERPALRVKRDGRWHTTTWAEYARDARRVARGLMALGAEPDRGVAIIGNNCPEWVLADVGAILCGTMPAGIYATSSRDQVRYITAHCDAAVAFAESPAQVAKFVAEKENLPKLRAVVQMVGEPARDPDATRAGLRILSWAELLRLGDGEPEERLAARIAAQKPDDVCTLIYTSGTTGDPKAVMITHTNIVWTARTILKAVGIEDGSLIGLSYLPLSHVAEQLLSIHGPMVTGALLYFCESVDKLGEVLVEVRPTLFLGVPRVWEKIQAKMSAAGESSPPVKKKLVAWARKVGLASGYAEQRGARPPLSRAIAKRLVFDTVKEKLGLDRASLCVTAAAPISRATLEFFLALGLPIFEVYGMSECTGPATYSTPLRYRTGKVGVVLPGTELKIADDGEICMRGPHVFRGYFKDEAATKAALDDDGWLHSGDIGEIDAEGFVSVTDRKKDLLITAGGENVAPQVIEAMLKGIPAVAQAVVVGDKKKYIAALLTLDPERLEREARAAGSAARTITEAAQCEAFRRYLDAQIALVNAKLARVQAVKRFTIVATEFSIDGGELTPTMKVKRKAVSAKYHAEIDALYAGA